MKCGATQSSCFKMTKSLLGVLVGLTIYNNPGTLISQILIGLDLLRFPAACFIGRWFMQAQ